MECPRCGFEQPEDRYCANCGLDIESFRSRPRPILERLLANPLFYVVMIGVVFVAAFLYIKANKIPQKPQNVAAYSGNTTAPVAQPNSLPRAATTQRRPSPTQTQAARRNFKAFNQTTSKPQNTTNTLATKTAAQPTAETAPAAPIPSHMEISFYEVDKSLWSQLLPEAKLITDQASGRAWSFAKVDPVTALLASSRHLPGYWALSSQASSTAAVHIMTNTTDGAMGLNLDATVSKDGGDGITILINGQLNLRGAGKAGTPGPEIHQRFETTALMPTAGALLLTNILPHQALSQNLAQLFAQTPLAIAQSPDFLDNATELAITILPAQ